MAVAAPSANKSGKPSPTSAQHVLNDYSADVARGDNLVSFVVDGGSCDVGVESTVIDVQCKQVKWKDFVFIIKR